MIISLIIESHRCEKERRKVIHRGWLAGLLLAWLHLGPVSAQPLDLSPIDCAAPAGDAEPGTVEWYARDAANMFCAEERHLDKASHPAPTRATAGLLLPTDSGDPYRDPDRLNGVRFRYQSVTVSGLDGEVYRPCAEGSCPALPDGLETFEPPYPAVIVLHGGAAHKELYWWASQSLAEAGYLVVAFDASSLSPTAGEAESVLSWLSAESNPFRNDVDASRVGIAGHSAGGVVASAFGQQDDRISAIVSWDRAQSGQMPSDLQIRRPALFLFADYNCQSVPVCQPTPYSTPPNPDGPGNKGEDFVRVRTAGVDSMQIALRAALHLDFVPPELSGNRYAEIVTAYYTLAWFDRYLKGPDDLAMAQNAYERLTASVFDDSADRHNISMGFWDPFKAVASGDLLYGGNVPYRIEGMPVANRLFFYYRSKCDIAVPGSISRAVSDDIRADGCSGGQ